MDPSGRKYSEHFAEFAASREDIQAPLNQLHQLHSRYLQLNRQFQEESLALENRYLAQYGKVFAERQAVINDEASKGIEDFWLIAMKNNGTIAEAISPTDEEALRSLRDIRIEDLGQVQGFNLIFNFAENAFFTDKSLTKTFLYEYEDGYSGHLKPGKTVGCTIHWKDGKNLSTLAAQSPADGDEESTSFFDIFDAAKSQGKEVNAGAADEEDDEDLLNWELSNDFDLGEEFRDTLVPDALYWYTEEARETGFISEDFETEDEDEDEDEE